MTSLPACACAFTATVFFHAFSSDMAKQTWVGNGVVGEGLALVGAVVGEGRRGGLGRHGCR